MKNKTQLIPLNTIVMQSDFFRLKTALKKDLLSIMNDNVKTEVHVSILPPNTKRDHLLKIKVLQGKTLKRKYDDILITTGGKHSYASFLLHRLLTLKDELGTNCDISIHLQ